MSPYHLVTRRKAKVSLGTTAVITSIFVSLIYTGLTLDGLTLERAIDYGTANVEIHALDILGLPLGPSDVDVVERKRKLPMVDVVESSRGLPAVDPSSNTTTALCCKAMFGNVDMTRVAIWVAYHRLLGFDHVFLYYHDALADFPGFDELESLPYLTMTPMKGKVVEFVEKSVTNSTNGTSIPYFRFVGEDRQHADQHALQLQCLNYHAKDYDWVLIADIDEYLSFNQEIGIKDFIAKYSDESTKALGFGKKIYTLAVRADTAVDSGFGLDNYPFTPGIYCTIPFQKYPTESRKECSGHHGSTKLIIRPQNYSEGLYGVHGTYREPGQIQINTDIARIREYQFIHQRVNATYHEKVDFLVTSGVGLRLMYFEKAFQQNRNGTWTIHYDDEPSKWYQYVASRGLNSSMETDGWSRKKHSAWNDKQSVDKQSIEG
jgi:hypothetical protein